MLWQSLVTFVLVIAAGTIVMRRAWSMLSPNSEKKSCGSCGGCSAPNAPASVTVIPLVQLGSRPGTSPVSAEERQS